MVGSSWLGIVTELRDGKSCELWRGFREGVFEAGFRAN